jgi:hypothetical protein
VVAKFREKLAVSKKTTQRFHIEKFNLKKLYVAKSKEQYPIEIANRFAVLENSDTEMDINITWDTIKKNIQISAKKSQYYYELKKHKS